MDRADAIDGGGARFVMQRKMLLGIKARAGALDP